MNDFDGAGNFYNKYESKNPLVILLVKIFLDDLESLIIPVKEEISSAFEIGCGEGHVTDHIYKIGIPIGGSDVSSRIIEIARTNYPRINFTVLSIYNLSTIDNQYDLVIINEVFEHLSSPENALNEVKKIAKKYILVSVPNEPYFRIANILRLKYLRDFGNTPGHINHWSKSQFKNFLILQGLKIKTIKFSTIWTMALCEI